MGQKDFGYSASACCSFSSGFPAQARLSNLVLCMDSMSGVQAYPFLYRENNGMSLSVSGPPGSGDSGGLPRDPQHLWSQSTPHCGTVTWASFPSAGDMTAQLPGVL